MHPWDRCEAADCRLQSGSTRRILQWAHSRCAPLHTCCGLQRRPPCQVPSRALVVRSFEAGRSRRELVGAESWPLLPFAAKAGLAPCSHAYAMVTSLERYTSWMALRIFTPSGIGFWNALRPEISPVPPARLLITAVRTAS